MDAANREGVSQRREGRQELQLQQRTALEPPMNADGRGFNCEQRDPTPARREGNCELTALESPMNADGREFELRTAGLTLSMGC